MPKQKSCLETASVAIPVLVVVVPVVLEDANMIVAPVVLEDAKKDVAAIVRTPVLELPQVSPPINHNHPLAVEEEVVVVTAPEAAKTVAVLGVERPAQMIVRVHAKMRVGATAQENVQRHVKAIAKEHVRVPVRVFVGTIAQDPVKQNA